MYTQCKISKEAKTEVCWIPSKYAQQGNVVRIKSNKQWEDGWFVEEIYNSVNDEIIGVLNQAYKHQRKMSDI